MVDRRYRVRVAQQGAVEVDGNVKFTMFLPAELNDHRLQRTPVITGQIPAAVTQARTESRPFTVHVLASDDLLAELATAGRWAILGSLLDVAFRDDPEDDWTIYGTGRISSIGEPDGPGIIPIEVSDEGWVARKGRVFEPDPGDSSTWNTSQIWPLGIKASWRGFNAAQKANGTREADDGDLYQVALTAGGPGWPGAQLREVTERMIRWISSDVREEVVVGTGATQGNFEHLRLNYGGTDYEVVTFGPHSSGAGRADLLDTLEEPDIQNPQAGTKTVSIRAWIHSTTTPPASGSAYLHAPTAQPSDDLPLHIGLNDAAHKWGAANGWIHFADLERRIADELGLVYDSDNYDEREADTSLPPLAFRLTSIPDDIETWLQQEVRSSLMHIALRDARGRRKLVDLRLPNADDVNIGSLPSLDASNTRAHTWQLLGREAVNVISWKYLRCSPTFGTSTFPGAPAVNPDQVALDGLHGEEVTWDPIEGDTIQGIGRRTLNLSLKGALEPTADIGRILTITANGRGALFADAARVMGRDILDVYQDGAFRGKIEVGRTLAETLEEGDLIVLDHDSLKGVNPGTAARSGQRIARILALTRHPAHAECEYLDLGPSLAPFAPPSLVLSQIGSEVRVAISNTPPGARVRLDLTYTSSAAEPTTWIHQRTNLGDGTQRFNDAPGSGWVHARARSEAEGRVRSEWVTESLQLGIFPAVAELEVILDEDGVPTLFGTVNGQTAGVRIQHSVYKGNQQPSLGSASDHAAADLATGITFSEATVPSPDPIPSAVLFEVEPWTGFNGSSVTGTPGVRVLAQKVRAQILFEHLNPRGLIELVSETDDDETLRFTGELGEGGVGPLEYRFAVTGLHTFTDYELMPGGEVVTDGTGDSPAPIPRGVNTRTVLLQVRDAGGRESQVASYALGIGPIGRDHLDPDLSEEIDQGILANVDLSLIEDIDREIHRVTGFEGEGILARLDGVGSNEILEDSVTTLHLAAQSVTSAILANEAVLASKLADLAVTAAKLANNAVTTPKLADAAVAAGKLAANAVGEDAIQDLAITADKVASSAISTAKIANDAVNASKLASGSVQAAHIVAGAVQAGSIASGAVTTAKLDALAVTADKIASNSISAAKIQSSAITAVKIAAGAVEAGKIAANAVQASNIAAGEINASHIGAEQILAQHIAANEITSRHLIIGSFDNLIQNPGFETGTLAPHDPGAGWSVNGSSPRSGSFSALWTPTGSSSTLDLNGGTGIENHVSAAQGDQFYFEAWVRSGLASNPNDVRVAIYFRNSSGGFIDFEPSSSVEPGTSYQRISTSGTAPAGTAYVEFSVEVFRNGTSNNGIRVDDCYARRMAEGSIIVDGTIFANHIAANAITAEKIQSISLVTLQATVGQLSALTADLGDVAAGRIRNPGASPGTRGILVSGSLPGAWDTYLDLTATGTEPILKHPGFSLLANGTIDAGNMEAAGALDVVANTLVHIESLVGAITLESPGSDIIITPANGIFINGQGPVTFGANNSAGTNFRVVRVPNT